MSALEFTIRRDPESHGPEGVEYWVYEEVIGATKQGEYVVIKMQDRSAFIPLPWVVEIKELKGDRND